MESSAVEQAGKCEEVEIDSVGVYDGERNENGERHGNGWALLPNGDIYVGQYHNGLRLGKDTYMFKNNDRYSGESRNTDGKYGQGTFWYPDGTRYEDVAIRERNGKAKHGFFGVYCYANNGMYEGSWERDLRHGMGEIYGYVNGRPDGRTGITLSRALSFSWFLEA